MKGLRAPLAAFHDLGNPLAPPDRWHPTMDHGAMAFEIRQRFRLGPR